MKRALVLIIAGILIWLFGALHCNHVLVTDSLYSGRWHCTKCGRVFTESYDPERGLLILKLDTRRPVLVKADKEVRMFLKAVVRRGERHDQP